MAVFGTWFGATTEGTVYSFGYTLLAGVIMNFIMACWATRLMTEVQVLQKARAVRRFEGGAYG